MESQKDDFQPLSYRNKQLYWQNLFANHPYLTLEELTRLSGHTSGTLGYHAARLGHSFPGSRKIRSNLEYWREFFSKPAYRKLPVNELVKLSGHGYHTIRLNAIRVGHQIPSGHQYRHRKLPATP